MMTESAKTIQSVMALMLNGHDIPVDIFKDLMIYFTSGHAADPEIAGFLKIFSQYPLKTDYVIAAIEVLRSQMCSVSLPIQFSDAIDCCGTGGDNTNSLNISTAVAFILADYGVTVAKHGNKSVTSNCGSADILEYLGYPIGKNPAEIIAQLSKTNLCFMFAPYFHPVLKYVSNARKELKIRTIFNLLGPLLNPALVKRQLIGVYDFNLAPVMAETLLYFGVKRAIIVNSAENADELTLTSDNKICVIDNGTYTFQTLNAVDIGLKNTPLSEIAGKDVVFNANAFKTILNRQASAYYDTVLLNAAAGLWVSDKAETILDGFHDLQKCKTPIDFSQFC